MKSKKYILIDTLCLFIINIFILLSKYSIEIKIYIILVGSIIFVLCLLKRQNIKLWIAVYVIFMTLLNIICFTRVHYIYMVTSNDTYNKNTKWMTTQTDYNWNTGNCDVILTSIFRNRSIYVMHDEKYKEYISYFAKEICYLRKKVDVSSKIQDFQEMFIPLGRMSPQITSWLWNDDMQDELSELRTNFDTTPRIYVSSESVANKQNLVVVSDEGYNLYIWPFEEFEEMMHEE